MAGDDTIGPVARPQFGGGHGSGGLPELPHADPSEPSPRRRLDEVVLTGPRRATLLLLRQRILERTRVELGLSRHAAHEIEFAAASRERADLFVGRLLSDQNLLASKRRDSWAAARIDAALETGMTEGLAETLDVLHEVGELDAESWGLVNSVLEEFHRKVINAQR